MASADVLISLTLPFRQMDKQIPRISETLAGSTPPPFLEAVKERILSSSAFFPGSYLDFQPQVPFHIEKFTVLGPISDSG